MSLCDICKDIFEHGAGWVGQEVGDKLDDHMTNYGENLTGGSISGGTQGLRHMYVQHFSALSMQRSALQGCYVCRTAWDLLDAHQQGLLLEADKLRAEDAVFFTAAWLMETDKLEWMGFGQPAAKEEEVPGRMLGLVYGDDLMKSVPGMGTQLAFFAVVPEKEVEHLDHMGDFCSSTEAEQSIEFTQRRYEECRSDHKICNANRDLSWMPTRLLCLSGDGDPRLVLGADIKPEPYFSLSHCWGSAQFIQLKNGVVEDFKKRIRLEDLPRTFREAIKMCRRLGAQYLWIDSLCIVQDDKEDWRHEASQMHKVYANSSCNICATASSDSSKGLFRSRDPDALRPCSTEIVWLEKDARFRLLDMTSWKSKVDEAPLTKRAWVVQEHYLAARHLHATDTQWCWECCELSASEQYPRGVPKQIHNPGKASRTSLHRSRAASTSSDALVQETTTHLSPTKLGWYGAVETYSKSFLTYPTDKVIAFAGIVEKYKLVLNDECVAGIWTRGAECQLLWHVHDCSQSNGSPSTRPEKYRAPSFSWLSVDGQINANNDEDSDDILVKIHSIEIEQQQPGEINSGRMVLEGTLRPVVLQPNGVNKLLHLVVGRHNDELGTYSFMHLGPFGLALMDEERVYNGFYLALPVRTKFMQNFLGGLLLELSEDSNEYRRIGVFMAYGEGRDILLEHNGDERNYECESYDEEKKTHLIVLT